MDAGPGTALGSVGWFTGVWATMMAAMMLPSLAPTAAVLRGAGPTRAQPGSPVRRRLSARLERRGHRRLRPVRARKEPVRRLAGLAQRRPLACSAGVLALAALYQLTPLKRAFLLRCRSLARFGRPWPTDPAGRTCAGSAQRRVVSRMLVGADGRAVRARRDEPHIYPLTGGRFSGSLFLHAARQPQRTDPRRLVGVVVLAHGVHARVPRRRRVP